MVRHTILQYLADFGIRIASAVLPGILVLRNFPEGSLRQRNGLVPIVNIPVESITVHHESIPDLVGVTNNCLKSYLPCRTIGLPVGVVQFSVPGVENEVIDPSLNRFISFRKLSSLVQSGEHSRKQVIINESGTLIRSIE